MKITCLQENFKKAINIVQNIVGKNLTLPILNNILLKTERGRLRLSSTNLEIGINTWVSGKIDKEGEITCPAKILTGFINNLPNKKIELEVKGNNLTVKCENYRAKINCLSADDFPIIPEIKADPIIEIIGSAFREALSQVVGLSAISESRPEITGVFLVIEPNGIKLVATDGFRLAEKKINEIKNKKGLSQTIILPQRTTQELMRVLMDDEGELGIIIENNQILFVFNETQIISRIIDGQYPDYQQIIPNNFQATAITGREEFLNSIKIASLFSSRLNDVKIFVKNNKMEILSQESDLGENLSSIPAEIKGKELEIVFNHRYLLDGLNNIKSAKISFGFNGEASPTVIRPAGDESYLYLIMPIKNN